MLIHMEILQFKTNVKCGGCVATITPLLDHLKGVESWKTDLTHPDRILTVRVSTASAEEIINTLHSAGYHAELLQTGVH